MNDIDGQGDEAISPPKAILLRRFGAEETRKVIEGPDFAKKVSLILKQIR